MIQYRKDIDGLRGLAVLLVLLFHFFPTIFSFGFIGVDIFFVLSGYLITSIILKQTQSNTFSLKNFYIKRAKRLFPTLGIVLILTSLLGILFLFPFELKNLGKHVISGSLFFANFNLASESGYFDTSTEFKPLLHLWSLAIEEQFYLIWPLLILLLQKLRILPFRLIIIALTILSFALGLYTVRLYPTEAFYLPQYRVWEILLGATLYNFSDLYLYKRAKKLQPSYIYISMLFFILSGVFINEKTLFPSFYTLLPTLGAFFFIISPNNGWIKQLLFSNKFIIFFGLISYSLYLVHWPLVSFLNILSDGNTYLNHKIILLIFSIMFSSVIYFFYERPFRYKKSNLLKTIPFLILIIAATFGHLIHDYSKNIAVFNSMKSRDWLTFGKKINSRCDETFSNFKGNYCLADNLSRNNGAILIGDSHAQTLYNSLKDHLFLKDYKTALLGKGNCPPLLDTEVSSKKMNWCQGIIDSAIRKIASSNQFNVVILHSRGSFYLKKVSLKSKLNKEEKSPQEILQEGLERTISLLIESGKKIVFVLPIPELNFSPAECRDDRLFKLNFRENCSTNKSEYYKNEKDYLNILNFLKEKFPSIILVSPLNQLCDKTKCYGKVNGKVIYRDKSHLNIYGISHLKDIFNEVNFN